MIAWDKDTAATVAYTSIINCSTLAECLRAVVAHEDVRLMGKEPPSAAVVIGCTAPTMRARGMVTPEEDVVVSSREAA